MNGVAATPLPLPGYRRRASVETAPQSRPSGHLLVRLTTFAALGAFAAAHWVALISHPPLARVGASALVVLAGAVALESIGRARIARPLVWTLAGAVSVATIAGAAIAVGLPARLLSPAGWSDLAAGIDQGFGALSNTDTPYLGSDYWARLTILLGMALWLGLAAALAFWPGRRARPVLRTAALVVLVAAYATAVTLSPPGAEALNGLALLALVAAWLWLPGAARREALIGTSLVVAAGLIALPAAARMDRANPWLDYRDWNWGASPLDGGESFVWDHSYGPLDWHRTGQTLLEVKSDTPDYWRAAVLDHFDGFRWVTSDESTSGDIELPVPAPGSGSSASLRDRWVQDVTFAVRGLRSQLLVGAGSVMAVHGLEGVAVEGLTGVAPTTSGLVLPADHPLSAGDSYTVQAYVPDPTAAQMRRAPAQYPAALGRYTTLQVPRTRPLARSVPLNDNALPSIASGDQSKDMITMTPVTPPLRGHGGGQATARLLSSSAYGDVYRLAQRLTAGAPTTYDAVQAVANDLRTSYSYSENPPRRRNPLRAFLFRDRAGYCQQFSGAMALMLRMVGIPARVASGFSPGTPSENGTYVVRDLDAHSWVEVYFNNIGWVPFDPTPPGTPASSRDAGLGRHSASAPLLRRSLAKLQSANLGAASAPARGGGSHAPMVPLVVPLLAIAIAVLASGAWLVTRTARTRSMSARETVEAQLRELGAALVRVRSWTPGGSTLLALERRLSMLAGPAAAGYAAKLRAARYEAGDPRPATPAERRALRRDLASGRGLRGRIRALAAIPPGGARPRSERPLT